MNIIQELRKIPFVRLLIPLMIGLITGIRFDISFTLLIITCLLLMILLCLSAFNILQEKYKNRWIFGLSLYIFIMIAGILLMELKLNDSQRFLPQTEKSEYFFAEVIDQPQHKANTVKVLLKITGHRDSLQWYKCKMKALTYFQKDNNTGKISNGDIIILKTILRQVKEPANPYEFNYKRFLRFKGIIYQSYIKSGTWQIAGHGKSLMIFASHLRNELLKLYRKYGFDNDEFAVLSALTLGYKDELGAEIKKAFSSAGAMHILAVSGLHTGIIFYVLNILFGFLGKMAYGKTIKLILVVLLLWFYALLTGLSISVIRAASMFSLIQFGNSFRRTINIYNILAVLAFFILVINPLQMCDVGFQLSFLAVLSIVFFQPRFYKLLTFNNRIIDKIWLLFTVSIAAQLGIFPIIIFYFHHFPVYFWITNLLIILPVAVVIYLAIMLFIFSPLGQVAFIIAKSLNLILVLINLFVNTVEKFPFSLIDGIYNTFTETVILYLIIISISVFVIYKYRIHLRIALFCILCFLSINLYRKYIINKQSKIVVFNINKFTALNFIEGRNNYLFTSIDVEDKDKILLNSVQNYWIKHGISDINKLISLIDSTGNRKACNNIGGLTFRYLHNNLLFNFKGKKLLLLLNTNLFEYTINKKFQLDYIIIANNLEVSIKQLTSLFDFMNIIIDSSNNYWTKKYWKEECEPYGIDPYIISEKGVFKLDI